MKIANAEDKTALVDAFGDPRSTVLFLFAESAGLISEIHETAEKVVLSNPDWKIFWVTDTALLSAQEKQQWCGAENQYVTFSRADDSGARIKKGGSLSSLCLSSGKPSPISIRKTFTDARL